MNKVVLVNAYFIPVGENKIIKVPTGEKKKGLLGGESDIMKDEKKWVQTGFSDRWVDMGRLEKDLQEAVESLNKEGYEVVSVTNIISGEYNWHIEGRGQGGAGYGYGYSYTNGLMVVAHKG